VFVTFSVVLTTTGSLTVTFAVETVFSSSIGSWLALAWAMYLLVIAVAELLSYLSASS
jgi:hypothetical protein